MSYLNKDSAAETAEGATTALLAGYFFNSPHPFPRVHAPGIPGDELGGQ